MSLEIIGAGYGRTGTFSLFTALNEIGYPCYHMKEILDKKENHPHVDFWNKVANDPEGQQQDWDKVFHNYRASVDNPGCCVWRELAKAYPNAKIVLTLHPRGAESWYESTIDTIYFTETMWQFKLLKTVIPFMRKFGNMTTKLIWQRSHKGTMSEKTAAIARYNQHIEEVKATIAPERLLIFSVDQGWKPLCDFLQVSEPSTPFPNVNDRAEIKKTISDFTKGAYVILGIGIVGAIVLIYALIRSIGY